MGDTISKKVTHRLFCTLRYIKHINRRLTKAARERGRAKKRCGRVLCEKSGSAEQHQVVERLDAGNQSCLDNCDALLMIIAEHLAVRTPPHLVKVY